MRMTRKTFAFLGAVLLVPVLSLTAAQTGAASPVQKPKTGAKAATKAATHSTSGVVQSITDASLVIAKSAKSAKTDTFVLNATTVKKGELAVGNRVGVRYVSEGGHNVATAVTAKGKDVATPVK